MKSDHYSGFYCHHANQTPVSFKGFRFAVLTSSTEKAGVFMQWIAEQGGECILYTTSSGFKQSVRSQMVDLVILDWELRDEYSSLEMLRWVRSTLHSRLGLIVISDNNAEEAIVSALRHGGDNFIAKPFLRESFLARVGALTKRLPLQANPLNVPPYLIDQHNREVRYEGRVVNLTHLEYKLTAYLFRHQGHVLSRETLLNSVWGCSWSVEERTVDTHISRIRNKLKLQTNKSWALKAISRRGYRLQRQTISPTQ